MIKADAKCLMEEISYFDAGTKKSVKNRQPNYGYKLKSTSKNQIKAEPGCDFQHKNCNRVL